MEIPIVELTPDDLVDDAERAFEVLPAARVAYAAIRPLPLARRRTLSLVLPPVIVVVPENEDAASAAKTLELRRGPASTANAVVPVASYPQGVPAGAAEPAPAAYPSVMPATLELAEDRIAGLRGPSWGAWAIAAALGVCGLMGVLAAGLSFYRHEPPQRAAAAYGGAARNAPMALTIPAATPHDGPASAGNDAAIDVDALPRAGDARGSACGGGTIAVEDLPRVGAVPLRHAGCAATVRR